MKPNHQRVKSTRSRTGAMIQVDTKFSVRKWDVGRVEVDVYLGSLRSHGLGRGGGCRETQPQVLSTRHVPIYSSGGTCGAVSCQLHNTHSQHHSLHLPSLPFTCHSQYLLLFTTHPTMDLHFHLLLFMFDRITDLVLSKNFCVNCLENGKNVSSSVYFLKHSFDFLLFCLQDQHLIDTFTTKVK